MELVDTHCHLDIARYFPDCEATLDRCRQAGVQHLVMAGVDRQGWQRMLELGRRYAGVYPAPGLHPMYLSCHKPEDLLELDRLTGSADLAAIGEVGLDYQVAGADRLAQQHLFEAQIEIAADRRLPLLLHVRKAHDQVLATLRRRRFVQGGIVHAFNGSQQQAECFIGLGFKIGICGTITYDRARKIRRVAAVLPLSSLVLETDAPDIPPVSHWGEHNQPEYLPEILEALVELRGESPGEIAWQTTRNALEVLRRS